MTALARTLQARGHDVIFLYSRGGVSLPLVPSELRFCGLDLGY
jgi:hypothetical protein